MDNKDNEPPTVQYLLQIVRSAEDYVTLLRFLFGLREKIYIVDYKVRGSGLIQV